MRRLIIALCLLLLMAWPPAAQAKVTMSFHSSSATGNFGRFAHALIVLSGTDDATGRAVDENYGFSAKNVSPAVLMGPVKHVVVTEKASYVRNTIRHFSVVLTQGQLGAVRQEAAAWRDHPGKYYDLDKRNCLHFVGRMAELVGLKVDYPRSMLRKPGTWLEHLRSLNPGLLGK